MAYEGAAFAPSTLLKTLKKMASLRTGPSKDIEISCTLDTDIIPFRTACTSPHCLQVIYSKIFRFSNSSVLGWLASQFPGQVLMK